MKKTNKPQTRIGTSGWDYDSWAGNFYPEGLPLEKRLAYYSRLFDTVEINSSFYRQPRESDYLRWRGAVPGNFVYAVKAPRFITHIKRLGNVELPWKLFISGAKKMGGKLGPVLLQFPENFAANELNLKRLEAFLKFAGKSARLAFEFRNCGFFNQTIYDFLTEYKAALVYADSADRSKAEAVTSDFMYVRMRGPLAMPNSKYTQKDLRKLADKINEWNGLGLDVYVYFNNDAHGYAALNAGELAEMLRNGAPPR